MKRLPASRIVIDANVIVKLFVPEPDSALVDELLSPAFIAMESGPASLALFAPDAISYEVLGILVKYVRRGEVDRADARQHVADFHALALTKVMTGPLLTAAYDLAMRFFITPYDGCYVALAEYYRFPLLTADDRQYHALADTAYEPLLLTHFR